MRALCNIYPYWHPNRTVEFTAQVYADTFTQLARRSKPDVLYPVIKHLPPEEIPDSPTQLTPYCAGYDTVFLSLNRSGILLLFATGTAVLCVTFIRRCGVCRYERKKNIALALSALRRFKQLREQQATEPDPNRAKKVLLVVAGGYDVRVTENVEYLKVTTHASLCASVIF